MSQPRWIWQCDRVIPSKTGASRRIRREVLCELIRRNWSKRDIFGVHLALEEALVNAVCHGNQLDTAKRVHVQCRLSDEQIEIEITDEGQGFEPGKLPDPTDEEHRGMPCGRGVMLMRRFMDRVEYNDRGNSVLLQKHRTDTDE